MSPRKYDSTRRRVAAEATRQQILEAARSLIGGKGDLDEFSVDAVAQKANVSRMTVYNQFRSRAGLVEALADHLAQHGGMNRMPGVFMAPSLEEGIRRLVSIFTDFWASDPVTMRRLRAMGVVFPSDSRGPRDRDEWRREAVRNLLQRHGIGRGGPSRKGSPELVDTISALTSFEMYDLLRGGSRKPGDIAPIVTDLVLSSLKRSN